MKSPKSSNFSTGTIDYGSGDIDTSDSVIKPRRNYYFGPARVDPVLTFLEQPFILVSIIFFCFLFFGVFFWVFFWKIHLHPKTLSLSQNPTSSGRTMNQALLVALLVAAANTPGAINIIILHCAKQRVKQTVIWNFRIGS